MKYLLFALLLISGSCKNAGDEVKDFIPGTYVKYAEGKFSKAWDTLRISAYEELNKTYVVEQHTGYQRLVKGVLQPKEFKLNKYVAVFEPSTHQLRDTKKGKVFTFSPEKGTVLLGAGEYNKIQ